MSRRDANGDTYEEIELFGTKMLLTILNTSDLHEAFFRNFLKSLKDSWCED